MGKYKNKPSEIEALQVTETNLYDLFRFADKKGDIELCEEFGLYEEIQEKVIEKGIFLETEERNFWVNVGDYLIKGENGEFYPCKPDLFEQTYELVNDN